VADVEPSPPRTWRDDLHVRSCVTGHATAPRAEEQRCMLKSLRTN
jgi:hypothetical protein